MMLKFESLFTFVAFKFSQYGALFVTDFVPLQTIDICKCLVTYFTGLQIEKQRKKKDNKTQFISIFKSD